MSKPNKWKFYVCPYGKREPNVPTKINFDKGSKATVCGTYCKNNCARYHNKTCSRWYK